MEIVIGNKFKLGQQKIGIGAFSNIFKGTNIQTGEEVALKFENLDSTPQQLLYEAKIYKILQSDGFPKFHWFGVEGDFNIMAIDMLGPSLEDLFQYCGQKFSLKTVLMLADQMITRIEHMHNNNFIHRDIKPENFLIGLQQKADQVFLIDYGLSRKFRDPRTGLHIPYQSNDSLTGTARYASINTHLKIEQSRRDDLESIGYCLMYFLKGDLPWMNQKALTLKEKHQRIREQKISTPIDVLCEGFPEEFSTYLKYCLALKFEEKPDYIWIRRIFKDLFFKLERQWDLIWDWALVASQVKSSQQYGDENDEAMNIETQGF